MSLLEVMTYIAKRRHNNHKKSGVVKVISYEEQRANEARGLWVSMGKILGPRRFWYLRH